MSKKRTRSSSFSARGLRFTRRLKSLVLGHSVPPLQFPLPKSPKSQDTARSSVSQRLSPRFSRPTSWRLGPLAFWRLFSLTVAWGRLCPFLRDPHSRPPSCHSVLSPPKSPGPPPDSDPRIPFHGPGGRSNEAGPVSSLQARSRGVPHHRAACRSNGAGSVHPSGIRSSFERALLLNSVMDRFLSSNSREPVPPSIPPIPASHALQAAIDQKMFPRLFGAMAPVRMTTEFICGSVTKLQRCIP